MHVVRLLPVALLLAVSLLTQPAEAVLQFYKVFQAEYLDNHPDQDWVAFVKKPANRCFICHQGKVRKNHNPYGDHLVELLDRRKDAKDQEKILAALKQVEVMHFDPSDEQSETYAERIAESKWPGGELDDLKKEPEGSEDE